MVKQKNLKQGNKMQGLYPNVFCRADGNISASSNDSGCEGLTTVAVHLQ